MHVMFVEEKEFYQDIVIVINTEMAAMVNVTVEKSLMNVIFVEEQEFQMETVTVMVTL